MDAMGLADRCRRDFTESDGSDFSFLHEIGDRSDAFLDRPPLVPAVQVVEVDDLGLQPLKALLAVLADHLRAAINLPLTLGVAEHAALRGEHVFTAPVLQYLTEQRFVRAESVERG